jgi:hypothetical protein
MFRFFRNIRHYALEQNRLPRYFAYALGEIVLVMVGILLALQVNNQNEARKIEKKIVANLREIQRDLSQDILNANRIFDIYVSRDSVARRVIDRDFSLAEYEAGEVLLIIYHYHDFVLRTNGYNSLMRNIDNLPPRYNNIVSDLNAIYVDNKAYIDVYNTRIRETVYKNLDYLAKEKPWFYLWEDGKSSEEMNRYYFEDAFYRNDVALYMNDLENIFLETMRFKIDAVNTYNTIDSLVGRNAERPAHVNYEMEDTQKLRSFTGMYRLIEGDNTFLGEKIRFNAVNGRLMVDYEDIEFIPLPLYWQDNGTFHVGPGTTVIRFFRDANGNRVMRKTNDFSRTTWEWVPDE